MNWKKRLLKKSPLYIILDKEVSGKRSIFDIAGAIKNSQACIIQYRDKKSKKYSILRNTLKLRKLFSKTNIVFIVNDYIDVAKIVGSDGIHLGQNDAKIETARKILGKDKIIGISCHNLKQAKQAQLKGADYIGVGPVFATSTKPGCRPIGLEELKKISRYIRIPFFAIGGINRKNLKEVIATGTKAVAVCRDICQAKSPGNNIREFQNLLK